MTDLFNPNVLGDGITIQKAPSDPKHAVRLTDIQGMFKVTRAEFTDVLEVTIPKQSNDFFVDCYDAQKARIFPDKIQEDDDNIVVTFAVQQSGLIRVLFIGEI